VPRTEAVWATASAENNSAVSMVPNKTRRVLPRRDDRGLNIEKFSCKRQRKSLKSAGFPVERGLT
jgi:hypothetical protein